MGEVVSHVRMFAIKSCGATTVEGKETTRLMVGPTGFVSHGIADRELVVIEPQGLFVSGRGWDEQGAIKHVRDRRLLDVAVDITGDNTVAASAAGFGGVKMALYPDGYGGKSRAIRMFGDSFWGLDQGPVPARFFSELLGREVRLVRVDAERPRYVGERYRRADAVNRVAGADGFPFLWTRQDHLDDLHRRAGWPPGRLPLNRFRANIETTGSAIVQEDENIPEEDFAVVITFGALKAYGVKPCSRCPIPDVAIGSLALDSLSTKLLRPYRTGWRSGTDTTGKPSRYFGLNLNHTLPHDEVYVGVQDPVRITDTLTLPHVVLRQSHAA